MKALITFVKFKKEMTTKFGVLYSFEVSYDEKRAFYNSKNREQTYFVEGKEVEFTEEERSYTDKSGNAATYLIIKPGIAGKQSNYGKALNKEQARYSTMATSYVKDLIVAGRVNLDHWEKKSREVCEWMVAMDKEMLS